MLIDDIDLFDNVSDAESVDQEKLIHRSFSTNQYIRQSEQAINILYGQLAFLPSNIQSISLPFSRSYIQQLLYYHCTRTNF